MEELVREQVLRRLNYVGDHIVSIKKMTEPDRHHEDILNATLPFVRRWKDGTQDP